MKKLLVAGSRGFKSILLLKNELLNDGYLDGSYQLVSGGAMGVDEMAEVIFDKYKLSKRILYADWDKFGKFAGIKRNGDMAELCDCAVIVWDGKSPGTKAMLGMLYRKDTPVMLYTPRKIETLDYYVRVRAISQSLFTQ